MKAHSTPDIQRISNYVERQVEVPKETLLHRIAGKESYALMIYIKSMVFHHAMKDEAGRLYFV